MYRIYVEFKTFSGKREAYIKKMNEGGYLSAIRGEEGCLLYDFYYAEKDADELLLVEVWESKAHQEAHMKTPHMAEVMELNKNYIESTRLGEFNLVEEKKDK